jgi:hypothetical protein
MRPKSCTLAQSGMLIVRSERIVIVGARQHNALICILQSAVYVQPEAN